MSDSRPHAHTATAWQRHSLAHQRVAERVGQCVVLLLNGERRASPVITPALNKTGHTNASVSNRAPRRQQRKAAHGTRTSATNATAAPPDAPLPP